MTHHYEAVLFDFDGVLIDSEPVHFACWREVMAPLGLTLDWPTYDSRLRGLSAEGLLQALRHLAAPALSIEAVRAIYPVKIAMFRERILDMEDLVLPEVRLLLDDLSAYKLAVVSSGRESHVLPLLERARVLHRFEAIICQEHVTEVKPSPEPYATAGARLGVQRALVVEDSEAGAQSGRGAGFDVVMVPDCRSMPAAVRRSLNIP